MKIKSIYLNNYKSFDDVSLELNGKSTVIYGINGAGKSSVLRAISLLFSTIINAMVKNRFIQNIKLERTDVSLGKQSCLIKADILTDHNNVYSYWRSIDKKDAKKTQDKDILRSLVNDILPDVTDEDTRTDLGFNIPVFVNYGTNRSVLNVSLRIRSSHDFYQLSCLKKAIENRRDFNTFFEWFRNQEDFENQKKRELLDMNYVDKSLQSVRMSVESMLDGFTNPRVNRHLLSMTIAKGSKRFCIELLSDGEKCALALFGDIARRLSIANPYMDNPLQGKGIVLIDEIELHLHPEWQKKILPTLSKIFPNIQFIITTHSPLVLSEIDDSYNIISLDMNDGHSVITYTDNRGR